MLGKDAKNVPFVVIHFYIGWRRPHLPFSYDKTKMSNGIKEE